MNTIQNERGTAAAVATVAPGEQPVGPSDLSHWAAFNGLTDHDALVMIAAVLCGLGNGLPSLTLGNGNQVVEPLSLVVPTGNHVHAALEEVIGSGLRIQQILVQRSRGLPLARVEAAYHSELAGGSNAELLESLEREPTHAMPPSAESCLVNDIQSGYRDRVFENVVRPAMITSGSLPEGLAEQLPDYHGGSMLAAPGHVRLATDPRRRQDRTDELVRFAEGCEVPSIELHRKTPGCSDRVRLCGILAMPSADMRWLLENRRDFYQTFIPWIPLPRYGNATEIDLNKVTGFGRGVARAALLVIARRRAFQCLHAGFEGTADAAGFLLETHSFRRDCAQLGESRPLASPERILPALTWTSIMLGLAGTAEQSVGSVIRGASRHLAGGAIQFFDQADRDAVASARLRLASKITERLSKKGPVKRRELVRGFTKQSVGLFNPVIHILVTHSVLRENRDGVLELGVVPVSRISRDHFLPSPNGCLLS